MSIDLPSHVLDGPVQGIGQYVCVSGLEVQRWSVSDTSEAGWSCVDPLELQVGYDSIPCLCVFAVPSLDCALCPWTLDHPWVLVAQLEHPVVKILT